jgi:hypothetical protein
MPHTVLEGCIEQVLIADGAQPGDHYADAWGNDWVVHEDREGLRLQVHDDPSVWIPYQTAIHIKLPALHCTSKAET